VLTLYDAARCPYCARVRIVLAEKGVEVETVEIDLDERPAWIHEKNPAGRVPVLEEDGWLLPESAVIMEYLDERWPEPSLLPVDPAERAQARLQILRFDALASAYYALRRGEDGAAERLDRRFGELDARLEGLPFVGGREYGLADVAYVPWVRRARSALGVELDAFPHLSEWLERLAARPAVAAEVEVVEGLFAR
jgi:RNA polymerase-associated protein